jgi:hypothetical protein
MARLAVGKNRKQVKMLMINRERLSGWVFVSDRTAVGAGPQKLIDLLTGPDRFLAFENPQGRFLMINRDHIVWMACRPDVDDDDYDPVHTRRVDLRLGPGGIYHGRGVMRTPAARARFSDWLNDARPFLRLVDDRFDVYVNRRLVLQATTPPARKRA